jgi:hypothetical protein
MRDIYKRCQSSKHRETAGAEIANSVLFPILQVHEASAELAFLSGVALVAQAAELWLLPGAVATCAGAGYVTKQIHNHQLTVTGKLDFLTDLCQLLLI